MNLRMKAQVSYDTHLKLLDTAKLIVITALTFYKYVLLFLINKLIGNVFPNFYDHLVKKPIQRPAAAPAMPSLEFKEVLSKLSEAAASQPVVIYSLLSQP